MGLTVYSGISIDPHRRAKEHARNGKVFDEVVVTSTKRSRKRAEKEETEAIQGNFLGPPALNKQKTGRKKTPFGWFRP
ncbi:MAG: hypothetical protein WC382_06010 [Methanoregulaceae archaeon]|jgi:hypothetical protein